MTHTLIAMLAAGGLMAAGVQQVAERLEAAGGADAVAAEAVGARLTETGELADCAAAALRASHAGRYVGGGADPRCGDAS